MEKFRKYTKNKMSFPTDDAVLKVGFSCPKRSTKNGHCQSRNWGIVFKPILCLFLQKAQIINQALTF